MLSNYEVRITELTNYVNSLMENFADEERVIKELDLDSVPC